MPCRRRRGCSSPESPCRLGEAIFSAGIRPKITPVIKDAMAANTNTGQRRDISFSRGVSAGSNCTRPCKLAAAAIKPAMPASAPTSTLSDNNCRMIRREEAPSAPRIAISRWRPVARASIRLATLAQAISRIKPTAPKSSSSRGRGRAYFRFEQRYNGLIGGPGIRHPPGKERQ